MPDCAVEQEGVPLFQTVTMTQAAKNTMQLGGTQRGPLHTAAYEYDGKSNKVPPAGEYLRAPVCCTECEAFWKALILEVDEKHTSRIPAGKASLILARGAHGSVLQIKSAKHHVTKERRFLSCKNVTVRADAFAGSCQSATTQISSNPTSIKSGDPKSRVSSLSRQGSLHDAYGVWHLHEVCACSFCSSPQRHSLGYGITDKPKSAIYPESPEESHSHRLFNTSSEASQAHQAISVGHGFKPIRKRVDQRLEEGFSHVSTLRRYTPILSHGLPSSSQLRPFLPPTTDKVSSREVVRNPTTPRMYSSAKHGEDIWCYSYAQTSSSRGRSDTHNYGENRASPKHPPNPEDHHQHANPNPGQDFLQKNSPPWTPQTSSARGRWNIYNDMNNVKASPTSNSYGASPEQEDYQKAKPNPGRGSIPRLSRTSTMESGYTSLSIPRSDSSSNSQSSPPSCKTLNAESPKVSHYNNLSRGTSSSSLMEPILLFTGHGCRSETGEDDDTNPNYFKHIIANPNYIKHIVKPIPPPPPPPGLKTEWIDR